jgi:hypothetical protein
MALRRKSIAMDDCEPNVPKPKIGDGIHTIARAGLGSLPIVGNAAVELFNILLVPPLEKRRDEWRESVGKRLAELEESHGINPEDLASNPAFVSATLQASYAAVRTHHEEKLEALRNAILNSALPGAPIESLQQTFIRWVDELTADHIRFLNLFGNARQWFAKNSKRPPTFSVMSSLLQLLESAYPEIASNRPFCDLIAQDLEARKLFDGGLRTMMSAEGAWQKRTSELGDQFLRFISPPESIKPA